MLVAVGHVVAALVAVAALVVKLGALLRDPKDQKIWASVAICLGCGLAVTVGWAPVHSAVDQFTRVPNLAKLAEHGSALLTATAIQFLFLHLGDPQRARRQIRRRLVLLAVVFTVMATMFWAADFPTSEPLHFADRYGDLPEVGVYMLAFLLYLAVSVADILRMSLGYARYAGTRLKVVMRLLSAGAAFGGAYVGHKAFFIALKLADGSAPWSEPVVSQTLVTLSVSFTCSSFVLSTIWKFVDDLRVWPRRSEAYRQLHALWYLLYQAVPTIALQPPRRPERARGVAWGAGQRLYRRCVEIGDGLQATGQLDPRRKAAARRRAIEAGWDQDRAVAAGEAAAILSAVHRQRQEPLVRPETGAGLEQRPPLIERMDVDAEARRLGMISAALQEPFVRAAAAEAVDSGTEVHQSRATSAGSGGRRDPGLPGVAAAQVGHRDGLAGLDRPQGTDERLKRVDTLTGHLRDDVPGPQTGGGRRTVFVDVADQDTPVGAGIQRPGDLRGQARHRDPEVRLGDPAVVEEVVGDVQGGGGGDREAD